jgi:hypothetical protein
MVMVVVHSILVASRGSNRLNASKQAVLDEHSESVVHRLTGDGTNIGLRDIGHFVGRHVRPTCDRAQHGDALGRRLDAAFSKLIDRADAH